MKSVTQLLLYLGIIHTLIVCTCSLPSDSETAQWQMHVEVPVIDKHFAAKDLLPKELGEGLQIVYGDSTGGSDTVSLVKEDTLTYFMKRELVSTDTSFLEEKMGAVTLTNTPPVNLKFNLTNKDIRNEIDVITLPSTQTIDQSQNKTLTGISSVTIDETSPPLQITLKNDAAQADLHNVGVTLSSGGIMIGTIAIPLLSATTAQTENVPMAGKIFFNAITVSIEATLNEGTIIHADDGLAVSFSLDNQVASDAELIDSMIIYSDTLTGTIGLADGIMLDAIDLEEARLHCEIKNPVLIRVFLDACIDDAWERDYVKSLNIDEKKQLTAITDSSHYVGKIIADTLFRSATRTNTSFPIILNRMRLFPGWNPDSSKSFLSYKYGITSIPDGRNIHYNKDFVFSFKLTPDKFPLIRIKGSLIDPIEESFSSEQNVGFGWQSSIIDSLKKHFRFNAAEIAFDFKPNLPPQSTIDTLKMHIALSTNTSPDSTVIDKQIIKISADSLYKEGLSITNLLNSWPDSIHFSSQLIVPEMTPLILHNFKNSNNNYNNTLDVGVNVHWKLSIPLSWAILDTLVTELEMSTIEPDLEDIEFINKLQNKRIVLNLEANNNTVFNFVLYAVCGSKKFAKELNAFPAEMVYKKQALRYLGDHLFTLFGQNGLELSPRGQSGTATIQLDEKGLNAILSGEKCLVRWFLVMPASAPDAFTVNDYLDLKASASVEGVGRADSLLHWEEK